MRANLLATLTAVATFLCGAPVSAQRCDFDTYNNLPRKGREIADSIVHNEAKQDQLVFSFPAARDKTAELVMSLLVRCQLPVSGNANGALEVHLPREIGFAAQYEITAHAYVVASGDSSVVTLLADETMFSGRAISPDVHTFRVTNKGQGRSFRVWRSFRVIRDYMASDSARGSLPQHLGAPDDQKTGQAFIGSLSKKLFMLPACSLIDSIPAVDRVSFSSEAEAKASGFLRSGAPGC